MAAVSLLQTGIIRHLPDPPLPGFDSDKVNSSETACALGVSDGTLSLASPEANIPRAAWGGADRVERTPLLLIAQAGKRSRTPLSRAGISTECVGYIFSAHRIARKATA